MKTHQKLNVINQINQYVFDNISRVISVEQVANLVGLSKYHLHRIFAAQTGFEIAEYIQRRKMEAAYALLQMNELSVIEIALEVGYESHSAFSRAFKKAYGLTPKQCLGKENHLNLITYKKSDKTVSHDYSTVWVNLPEQILYGVYCRGFEDQSFAKAANENFVKMTEWSSHQDYLLSQPFGVSLDNPWINTSDKSDFFCGFLSGLTEDSNHKVETLYWPAGHYICSEYVGPYQQMWQFISKLHSAWLNEKKLQLSTRRIYQRYLNHPADTSPENLKTLLYFPVEKIF